MNENVDYWNELASIHKGTKYYDIEKTIRGESTLLEIEKVLLGNLSDKRVLHLQCHMGQDTISLARMSKKTVGVDYSKEAIQIANELKKKCNISNVEFVCKDILKLDEKHLNYEKFDVAVATYGVLAWIKDLHEWVRRVSAQLCEGGKVLIVDEHPFASIFSGKQRGEEFIIEAPYSIANSPYITKNLHSYADDKVELVNSVQYKWAHSFEEIFAAFRDNGIKVIHFKEYFKCFYQMLYGMQQANDGFWYLDKHRESLPLMFSLMGQK